jgi:hypothetical protein
MEEEDHAEKVGQPPKDSARSPMEKTVLKLVRNVKRTDSRTIVVGQTETSEKSSSVLKEVQQAAANKMRISMANLKLFTAQGDELSLADQDYAESQIRLGGTLYASGGEPFVMDKILGTVPENVI